MDWQIDNLKSKTKIFMRIAAIRMTDRNEEHSRSMTYLDLIHQECRMMQESYLNVVVGANPMDNVVSCVRLERMHEKYRIFEPTGERLFINE